MKLLHILIGAGMGLIFCCGAHSKSLPESHALETIISINDSFISPYSIEEERDQLACTTDDQQGLSILARNGLIDTHYRWKQFRVYIDPSYDDAARNRIISAMQQLGRAVPCLPFSYFRKGERPSGDFVHIFNGEGCYSYVGKLGGRQVLSLQNPGCMSVGTIMHEMIHALGIHHEQSRPDRDNYVNIHYANMRPGTERNFEKLGSGVGTFDVPYNFQSIMHYRPFDFSKNRQPTITKKNGSTTGIGTTGVLQQTDIQKLKIMYKC